MEGLPQHLENKILLWESRGVAFSLISISQRIALKLPEIGYKLGITTEGSLSKLQCIHSIEYYDATIMMILINS